MKQLGNPQTFKSLEKIKALKAEKKLPMEIVVGGIGTDYAVIRWWAQEMRGMAQKLAEVRDFVKANPKADPETNNTFRGLRRGLAEHLKGVASRTRSEFGDPWGLVAMDLATGRAAKAEAQVTGPRVAFKRARGE